MRLLGIALTSLTTEEPGEQLSLFGEESDETRKKNEKLDKAVDALRNKFGSDIIQRGTVMASGLNVARKFKASQDSEESAR